MASNKEAKAVGRGKSFTGSSDAIAEIIGAHLQKPSQLKYPEKMNSKVQRGALAPWRDVVPDAPVAKQSLLSTHSGGTGATSCLQSEVFLQKNSSPR